MKSYDNPNPQFNSPEIEKFALSESVKPRKKVNMTRWMQMNIKEGTELVRKGKDKSEAKVGNPLTCEVVIRVDKKQVKLGGTMDAEKHFRKLDNATVSNPQGWMYWGIIIEEEWKSIHDIYKRIPNEVLKKRKNACEITAETDTFTME